MTPCKLAWLYWCVQAHVIRYVFIIIEEYIVFHNLGDNVKSFTHTECKVIHSQTQLVCYRSVQVIC